MSNYEKELEGGYKVLCYDLGDGKGYKYIVFDPVDHWIGSFYDSWELVEKCVAKSREEREAMGVKHVDHTIDRYF